MTKNEQASISTKPQEVPGPHPNEAYDDTKLLSRIDTLEKSNKHLTKIVDFVQNTNSVVLLVLALGFVALLVTVIGSVVQTLNDKNATQIELIKSMESLKNEIDQKITVKELIIVSPSPSPTTQSAIISN